jgi:WD40 repeat protein
MSTISDLAFSRDGRRLASASFDRTVKCWNLIHRELEWSVLAHSNRALAVAFTPDGTRVVSAGVDSIIRFWATESGIEMGQLPVSEGPISDLVFDPKGEALAARTTRQGMLLYRPPAIESNQER